MNDLFIAQQQSEIRKNSISNKSNSNFSGIPQSLVKGKIIQKQSNGYYQVGLYGNDPSTPFKIINAFSSVDVADNDLVEVKFDTQGNGEILVTGGGSGVECGFTINTLGMIWE